MSLEERYLEYDWNCNVGWADDLLVFRNENTARVSVGCLLGSSEILFIVLAQCRYRVTGLKVTPHSLVTGTSVGKSLPQHTKYHVEPCLTALGSLRSTMIFRFNSTTELWTHFMFPLWIGTDQPGCESSWYAWPTLSLTVFINCIGWFWQLANTKSEL